MIVQDIQAVVVGPGSMGCLLAGYLGPDVWLLDHNSLRAEQLSESGITIENETGQRVVEVKATADPSKIGKADILITCVKAYDTRMAIQQALPVVTDDTIIVSLQNGLGNAEAIAEAVNPSQIVCAMTGQGACMVNTGHIRHAGFGKTTVASYLPENKEKAERVAAYLTSAAFETEVVDNVENLLWSKLILNAAINPLTAISKVRNGQLLQDPKLREELRRIVSEAASVARAKGIKLLYENEVEEVERVCRLTKDNISSMYQDLQKGSRTEIDFINGAIVREGHAIGLNVVENEKLLKQIQQRERNET